MALDLEAERDLSLIFERDEIAEAFAGHCTKTHEPADNATCRYCMTLMAVLAEGITEWLALVDQDRATRKSKQE